MSYVTYKKREKFNRLYEKTYGEGKQGIRSNEQTSRTEKKEISSKKRADIIKSIGILFSQKKQL